MLQNPKSRCNRGTHSCLAENKLFYFVHKRTKRKSQQLMKQNTSAPLTMISAFFFFAKLSELIEISVPSGAGYSEAQFYMGL